LQAVNLHRLQTFSLKLLKLLKSLKFKNMKTLKENIAIIYAIGFMTCMLIVAIGIDHLTSL